MRGHEKAGRCSFFNKDDFLLMIERAQLIGGNLSGAGGGGGGWGDRLLPSRKIEEFSEILT